MPESLEPRSCADGHSPPGLPSGREKSPDPEDPMDLHGVVAPGDPALMARCIIEEYARMGASRAAILAIFTDPGYRTHGLLVARGEAWVRRLVDETLAATGTFRFVEEEASPGGAGARGRGRPLPTVEADRPETIP